MMNRMSIKMTTTVPRAKLVETLKANAATHSRVVAEARVGFAKAVRAAVERKLQDLERQPCQAVVFNLHPPQDYSEVYKTAIQMLDWNTDETVVLAPDEFRQLVQDEWDWQRTFLLSNAVYSATARRETLSKYGDAVGGAAPGDDDDEAGGAAYGSAR